MMDMIATVITALLVGGLFLLAFYGAVMLAAELVDAGPIERIREWNRWRRKLATPPCSKCRKGDFICGIWCCDCPEYKEFIERVKVHRLTSVASADIRGTKWCRYEPGLEDGEGI